VTGTSRSAAPKRKGAARSRGSVPPPEMRSPGKVRGPRADRTIAAIIDATRQVFLTRGYAGTTIDEISKAAGVSRASFYTYFPSKRDALLALGAESAHEAAGLVDQLDAIELPWTEADIAEWVGTYFTLLDEHGSFAFAWTQAANEDDELLRAGAKSHLELCGHMGESLAALAGVSFESPVELGVVVFSLLERTWSYRQLYADMIDQDAASQSVADLIVALLRGPPVAVARGRRRGTAGPRPARPGR
jgi:AcrR family transcriptional regulator